jgi:hypothetical protein
LLSGAGLQIDKIVDDSGPFQILGSEKIANNLALIDPVSNSTNFPQHFSKEKIMEASAQAQKLNAAHRGDSIAVHVSLTHST